MSYREKKRSRSRSRGRDSSYNQSRSRDNDYRARERDHRGNYDREDQGLRNREFNRDDREYGSSRGTMEEEKVDTKTIIIKGLPAHTTEPSLYAALAMYSPQEIRLMAERDTGECKGFAFVEFYTKEHAIYFMGLFAGSSGDPNAPQLIIDGRAVILDYAKDDRNRSDKYKTGGGGGSHVHAGGDSFNEKKMPPVKSDWICENCQCQNFARRNECYRCSAVKTDTCILLSSGPNNPLGSLSSGGGDAYTNAVISTITPNTYLAVRGLGLMITEDQLIELFRPYAQVKSAIIVRDKFTGISRGLGLIEFHTIEHATHTLKKADPSKLGLDMGTNTLTITYAKPSFVTTQLTQIQEIQALQQQQQSMLMYGMPPAPWGAVPGMPTPPVYPPVPGMPVPPPMLPSAPHTPLVPVSHTSIPGVPIPPPSTTSVSMKPTSTLPPMTQGKYPPNFETHGGAYIFQSQSGYFLDPVSEYYYDPKSKLYYNSNDGTYYTYDLTKNPPYVLFLPPLPTDSQSAVTSSTSTQSTTTKTMENKDNTESIMTAEDIAALVRKPVILSIGNIGNKSKAAKTTVNKKVLSNISKWESARDNIEDEQEGQSKAVDESPSAFGKISKSKDSKPVIMSISGTTDAGAFPSVGVDTTTSSVQTVNTVPTSVLPTLGTSVTPASTLPIPVSVPVPLPVTSTGTVCLLCRRQFASAEQLIRHEKESKLHAENLLKLQQQQQQQQSGAPTTAIIENIDNTTPSTVIGGVSSGYRDRASERRAIHGDSIPIFYKREIEREEMMKKNETTMTTTTTAHIQRKMSYDGTSTTTLASSTTGSGVGAVNSSSSSYTSNKTLKDDYDNPGNQLLRKMGWNEGQGLGKDASGIENPIEATTRGNTKVGVGGINPYGSNSSSSGGGSGEGNDYRESLLRATRARYEQISKKE